MQSYEVYNKDGIAIYPVIEEELVDEIKSEYSVGDLVKIIPGATFTSGLPVPSWLIKSKVYIRKIKNGTVMISTSPRGSINGTIYTKYITINDVEEVREETP
jgi:hypothetical protein